MIHFDIRQLPDGRTVATLGEVTATGQDPCRAIARDLVDAGAADEPWEMARDGRVAMTGRSLHWLAASVVLEGEAGFSRRWWSRNPHAAPRPVLEAVVERCKAEARERKRRMAAGEANDA